MWPRVVELMLGVWLGISPVIVGLEGAGRLLNVWICAAVVVTASCLSYWKPTRNARFASAVVALWLLIRAYIEAWGGPHPVPPPLQNEFTVGLLLLMHVIIPNDNALPARGWRKYVKMPPPEGERS